MSSSWSADAPAGAGSLGFARDDRGGPLAEMAVVLLPFMLIIAMIVEGGNMLWRHQIALKSARDTTRYLSRVQLLFDENCDLDGGVLGTVTATAKTLGVSGLIGGGAALLPGWTGANIEVQIPEVLSINPCRAVVRAAASVELPLPFAPIFRIFNPDQPDTISFSVADQARWVGE